MRPGRCQIGMNIEIVSIFFYSDFSSMRCSEAKSPTETGLTCICVHIHPTLNSSRPEDSQLGPAGGGGGEVTYSYIIINLF